MNVVFVLLLYYYCLLVCTAILLDSMKWLGMIIYLVDCLWLIMCYFAAKCSNDFTCNLIYYILCILLYSCLILSVLRMKWDFFWNITLLGDFSYPFSLVLPDSMDFGDHWDGCGFRIRLCHPQSQFSYFTSHAQYCYYCIRRTFFCILSMYFVLVPM